MIKILKYLKKQDWSLICIAVVFIVLQVYLDLRIPDYMSEITRMVQTPGHTMSEILPAGGMMILYALGSLTTSVIVGGLAAKSASSFASTLRKLQFKQVESFSINEMNKFSTASLITRSTNDVTQVQMLISFGLQALIKAPITAVWAITKIMGKGTEWTIATALAVLFMLLLVSVIFVLAMPRFKIIQTLIDNLNRVTRENLTGIRVVRAYNAEEYQESKFNDANNELTKNSLFANRVMSIINPGINIVMNGLSLSIYWIGAYLIDAANMMDKITHFSNMVVFSSYAMQIVMSFMMLTMIIIMSPRATVAAKRILEVIETKSTINSGNKVINSLEEGVLEFKNVSFKYPDASEYVLKNINFKVNKGETVAFIGSTGSGKSTLINLIPRFYDVTEGQILLDGVDIREYTLESLYDKLGYISQKAMIFSGTIRSNIDFGHKSNYMITDETIEKALNVSQSKEFVEKLPLALENEVSQSGTNLSGGQKQRLSIARAVNRQPDIYIFDDSFSALDYKTDKNLRDSLKEEVKEALVLIVAQRIGTIREADKIVVLDEGSLVGIGTHDELMINSDVYKEIALSQLSAEELA